jgi:hypothetical protein
MTLLQAILCWLIINEIALIALIESGQLDQGHRPEHSKGEG